jgi:hypothetical protein
MCLHISNPKISLEAASVMLQYVLSALVLTLWRTGQSSSRVLLLLVALSAKFVC